MAYTAPKCGVPTGTSSPLLWAACTYLEMSVPGVRLQGAATRILGTHTLGLAEGASLGVCALTQRFLCAPGAQHKLKLLFFPPSQRLGGAPAAGDPAPGLSEPVHAVLGQQHHQLHAVRRGGRRLLLPGEELDP